jgi:sialate O-acetylesterase
LLAVSASAEVKPHGLFSDNAVLQQGISIPIWGTAKDGEKVTVELQGQKQATTAKEGRWTVRLNPLKPGGPFTMTIRGDNTITITNILVGEVWLCSGQSNMAWPLSKTENAETAIAAANDPMLRLFTVSVPIADEPRRDVPGNWRACAPETVAAFSGVGYYFGRDLSKARKVPVGLIQSAVNGTPGEAWISRAALDGEPRLKGARDRFATRLEEYPRLLTQYNEALARHKDAVEKAKQEGKQPPAEPRPPLDPRKHRDRPTGCYNACIAPLQPCALKGVLWYQGEANVPFACEYRSLLPLLIRTWREAWNSPDLSFLIVQIAPCGQIDGGPVESAWAELREAQLLTSLHTPNTGIAVITDCGENADIHPRKKEPVGARLALAARGLAYGEKIVYSGPIYQGMKREGDKAVLSFEHTGSGLAAQGGELKGFAVAGEDRKFITAQAEIRENKVVVWSQQVAKPVAVRFGWANFPVVNLYNKEGLPASPFRTDDFPLTTALK